MSFDIETFVGVVIIHWKAHSSGKSNFFRYKLNQETIMVTLNIDRNFLIPFGVLKVIEIFCLMIAFSTVEGQVSGWYYRGWQVNFHLTICIMAFVIVTIWFILDLFGVLNNITIRRKNFIFALIHFIMAVFVVFASSFLTDRYSRLGNARTITAGGAFGIISAIFLVVDAFLRLIFKGDDNETTPAAPSGSIA